MKLRHLAVILLLFTFVSQPFGASAQTPVAAASVEVDLWPEYDQPSMLVIYRIQLSPQVSLPAELSVRIPKAAGEPHAVAERQVDDTLVNAVYKYNVEGEWGRVDITATSPEIQLEYYDSRLNLDTAERTYTYQWAGDFAVDDFIVQIQQPLGAASLTVSPDLGVLAQAADGLMYYRLEVGKLDRGQAFQVELSYIKENTALSIESMQVEPSAPLEGQPAGSISVANILPWVLGALGVVLLVGGVVWYWRMERETTQEKTRKRRRKKATREDRTISSLDQGTEGEVIYCHQCGKRAEPGDRFCRSCGARLRSAE